MRNRCTDSVGHAMLELISSPQGLSLGRVDGSHAESDVCVEVAFAWLSQPNTSLKANVTAPHVIIAADTQTLAHRLMLQHTQDHFDEV